MSACTAIVLALIAAPVSASVPTAGEVIAADQIIDQSPPVESSESATDVWLGMSALELGAIVVAIGVMMIYFRKGWHRFDAHGITAGSPQITPPIALALFIGFIFLGQAGATIAARMWEIDPAGALSLHDKARLTLGACIGQSIALASYLFITAGGTVGAAARRTSIGKSLLFGCLGFAMAWPVVIAVGALAGLVMELIRGTPSEHMAHETLRMMHDHPVDAWFIVLALMIVCVTPMMEEVAYRGLVQTAAVRAGLKRWPAIVLTSAAFTIMHAAVAEPHALVSLFMLSMAFGWAYERTGRLATPIVIHALFNAANLAMARWMV